MRTFSFNMQKNHKVYATCDFNIIMNFLKIYLLRNFLGNINEKTVPSPNLLETSISP